MSPVESRDRSDLVLNPGEFAFVQDRSKGNISVNVGPLKTSMSDTESTVSWDDERRRFRSVEQGAAVQSFVTATEGSYVVLRNPAKTRGRPEQGKATNVIELEQGRRIHMNGPVHFPLWPGEVANVIEGHQLRSNEYLIARVYNEDEALAHWDDAVMKPQVSANGKPHGDKPQVSADGNEPAESGPPGGIDPARLRTGQLLVIRGNEISFFVPPTGIEVLPDSVEVLPDSVAPGGDYVRRAVTLERLEYCILLDEDGNKRYVRGPNVVFPEPTETFMEKGGQHKFKATELSKISGIFVKVIEGYQEEDGQSYKVGDELFITGKDSPIYFPRQEHAIIKYGPPKGDGGQDAVYYAVAVPAGEGRYVLDRDRGEVKLVRGPTMLLPDPRREVIVQRVVDPSTIDLWYPGNKAAREHNEALQKIQQEHVAAGISYLAANAVGSAGSVRSLRSASPDYSEALVGANLATQDSYEVLGGKKQLVQDSLKRGTSFTPPRTVVLDTKYDGAVAVSPWTGFAVQVVGKTGKRKVVAGPATQLLDYDETLSVMELSTGTPKSDQNPIRTVYLRVQNNRVSDIVTVETRDLCKVNITVSYRVNFEAGQEERWFAVENYVRFLTEHCGSRIRNTVKRLGIEEFYANPIDVVRTAILGPSAEGKRPGLAFAENGMRVYDVEVLQVAITNQDIAKLLVDSQHTTVKETLAVAQSEQKLARTLRLEEVSRQEAEAKAATQEVLGRIRGTTTARELALDLADADAAAAVGAREKELEEELQAVLDSIAEHERNRAEATERREFALRKDQLDAEAAALKARMEAFGGNLADAMTRFADQSLMERLAESLAPLALLENQSVTNLFGRYIEGTPMAAVLDAFKARTTRDNGGARSRVTGT